MSPFCCHPLPDLLARSDGAARSVVRMKRSNETFSRSIHLLEPAGVAGREFERRSCSSASRGLDHLQAVLVGAGEEEYVLAVEPLKARQRVGRDRLIGVTDMRHAVRIGDRGRDVDRCCVSAAFGFGEAAAVDSDLLAALFAGERFSLAPRVALAWRRALRFFAAVFRPTSCRGFLRGFPSWPPSSLSS